MPVTLNDIALLAGISRQAVAAALEGSGSSRVSAATRTKVLELAAKLNYVPNMAARNLRGGRSKTIGILCSPGMPHSNMVYAEVNQILRSWGYSTVTMDHAVGELPVLCNSLVSFGCLGIILMDYINTPSKLIPLPELPLVVCRTKFGWSDVDVNKEMTGFIAAEHLLNHGHSRVDFMTTQNTSNSRRAQGWRRALKEHKAQGRVIELREFDGSAAFFLEYVRKNNVTAICCANDYLAAKAMRVLSASGLRIPDDVALIGCDGYSFVEFTAPSLTTVIQPVHELAARCADLMRERIEKKINGLILERIGIEPRLWLGGSCGCPDRVPDKLFRLNTTGNLEKDYRLNFNEELWPDMKKVEIHD